MGKLSSLTLEAIASLWIENWPFDWMMRLMLLLLSKLIFQFEWSYSNPNWEGEFNCVPIFLSGLESYLKETMLKNYNTNKTIKCISLTYCIWYYCYLCGLVYLANNDKMHEYRKKPCGSTIILPELCERVVTAFTKCHLFLQIIS